LGDLLSAFKGSDNPDLIVGFDTSDDAGVYRIGESLALVQTVDLITPVCDDPYVFGQVAAANALSDVYAMGGRPLTALNICCFPGSGVPDGVFGGILSGARDKVREAGATIVGGHTVKDAELKYGLAVTGTIDPSRILRNASARPGDALVLTKPIGTGVIINAARKDRAPLDLFHRALERMARLNAAAAAAALDAGARACTDITGFGLAGHALEMARASGVGIRLRFESIPRYQGSIDLIEAGVGTAMTGPNRDMAGDLVRFPADLPDAHRTLLFDPQTSGGLLIALPAGRAAGLLEALHRADAPDASVVGEVMAGAPGIEVLTG